MNGFWDVMGIPLEACAATALLFMPYVLWPLYGWWVYGKLDNLKARKLMREQARADAQWADRLTSDIEHWDGLVPDDLLDRPFSR